MPKTVVQIMPAGSEQFKRKRVAAYARVSCGKDAMLHSLATQIDYYREMITSNLDWEFAGVFADEAKTGTKENRPGFQELLALCRNGKVDMIITKSISRFARNTVTLLNSVRELKKLGVEVLFEEQNINTAGTDGELMLTLLASFAQAESLSCSDNVKWRIRNGFEQGRSVYFSMLGYEFNGGDVIINPDEMETVRKIFDLYNSGYGFLKIANTLNEEGIKTKRGHSWNPNAISKILRNEKYAGDLRLQKTFVDNHITKKKCDNNGELPMVFVENNHEAIIDRNSFEHTQAQLERRANRNPNRGETTAFTGKIKCSDCGKNYRRKTTATGIVWICATFNTKGKKYCMTSKAIPEPTLKSITASILGIAEFDEDEFTSRVRQITALPNNRLRFEFTDGRIEEAEWQDRSRSESWTEEKRKAASEKTTRRYHNA